MFFKKIVDNDTTVGRCYYLRPFKRIVVDPTYWATASEEVRLQLVLHELGHCVLNRDHDERYTYFFIEDGMLTMRVRNPVSLMYPTVDVIMNFEMYKDYYIKELCEGY